MKKTPLLRPMDRREALLSSVLGLGSLALRSLVTGLPMTFLLGKPESSWAAENAAKFLILSHMQGSDPINTNVPGTYGDPNDLSDPLHAIAHATVAELGDRAQGFEVPSQFQLGPKTVRAAQAWSGLPQELLDRSAFWHHGTYVNAHTDFDVVMSLGGAIRGLDGSGTEQLASFVAQENHQNLGTISKELIRVGGTAPQSNGVSAPELKPSTLKNVFATQVGDFERMLALRDQFLDQTYSEIKSAGTPAQRQFLDRYAISRQESQDLGDNLASLITDIKGNTPADQAKMAAALIQLKVAPVITLGMPFGGDNHQDSDLADEVDETQETISALNILWDKLTFAQIQDHVVFANLNVFGRTLKRVASGGRDHNGGHHCMYVFGSSIQPGVVGGLETYARRPDPDGSDFKASAINSTTGGVLNPDIPFEQTLSSVGKTLAAAVGISDERIEVRIETGRVITGALL